MTPADSVPCGASQAEQSTPRRLAWAPSPPWSAEIDGHRTEPHLLIGAQVDDSQGDLGGSVHHPLLSRVGIGEKKAPSRIDGGVPASEMALAQHFELCPVGAHEAEVDISEPVGHGNHIQHHAFPIRVPIRMVGDPPELSACGPLCSADRLPKVASVWSKREEAGIAPPPTGDGAAHDLKNPGSLAVDFRV